MVAHDRGTPPKESTNRAVVTITVEDMRAPQFLDQQNYIVNIDINRTPGDDIYQTSIVDLDRVSSIIKNNFFLKFPKLFKKNVLENSEMFLVVNNVELEI